MRFRVERICRSDSMSVVPLEAVRFDLQASAERLRREGYAAEPNELYLVTRMREVDVTIYPSGRVLVRPMKDKAGAKELAQRLFALMVRE